MANVIEFTLKTDDKATKGFQTFSKTLSGTAKTVKRLTLATIAGATAIVAFTKVTANAQDQAGKFALKIGKSVENLTKYQFAAKQSGIRTETFNMAIQRMERRLGEAAVGTGEALGALNDLGIEAKTFADLPLDTQLQTLAEKFSNMESGTTALKTAFKLFDSEGVVMLQLLKKGSPAMKKMAERAEELGLVVSEQAAANSERFNDSLGDLFGSIEGVSRVIGNDLMPIMTGLSDSLADLILDNKDLIAKWFKDTFRGMVLFGLISTDVFNTVKIAMRETFEGNILKNFAMGAVNAMIFIAEVLLTGLSQVQSAFLTGFIFIWDSFTSLGKAAWTGIKAFFSGGTTVSITDQLFKDLDADVAKAFNSLKAIGDIKFTFGDGDEGGGLADMFTLDEAALSARADALIASLAVFGDLSKKAKKDDLEDTRTYLNEVQGVVAQHLKTMGDVNKQLAQLTLQNFLSATQGIGDAIGASIVQGQNLLEGLANVGKSVVQSLISGLVQMGLQYLILGAINDTLTSKQAAKDMAVASAKTYANTFANVTAIPGGIVIAPAVAAGTTAVMLAGATGAGAAGAGVGASIGALHGGLDFVPREQTALLDQGERIVSPNQNRDLTNFLADGGGGGGGGVVIQNINILPNATNAEAFMSMSSEDMRRIVEEKIIAALDELDGIGIRQNALDRLG